MVLVTDVTSSSGWVSRGFDTRFNGVNDVYVARITSAGTLAADLTGNGFVDFEDLNLLLAAWNPNVSAAYARPRNPLRRLQAAAVDRALTDFHAEVTRHGEMRSASRSRRGR